MILLYIIFFAIGIAATLLLAKLGWPLRVGIGLAIFLIPSIIMTIWVARVGDRPAPDSVIVVPKPGGASGKDGE